MSFYRSKPRQIEAFQWTGGPDQTEDPEWIVQAIKNGDVVFRENLDDRCVEMRVTTIQGQWVYCKPGEWIVREEGCEDRFYPIADSVFRERYEAVSEE